MSLNLCQKQTKLRKSIALTSQISLVILRLLHVLLPQMHQLAPTQQAAMLGFKFVFKPFQGYIELGLIWKMLLPPIQISQYWKKIHLNSNGQINSLEKLFCVLLPTQVEFTKTKPPFVCFSLIFSPPILQWRGRATLAYPWPLTTWKCHLRAHLYCSTFSMNSLRRCVTFYAFLSISSNYPCCKNGKDMEKHIRKMLLHLPFNGFRSRPCKWNTTSQHFVGEVASRPLQTLRQSGCGSCGDGIPGRMTAARQLHALRSGFQNLVQKNPYEPQRFKEHFDAPAKCDESMCMSFFMNVRM